jgi:hypothetical protein
MSSPYPNLSPEGMELYDAGRRIDQLVAQNSQITALAVARQEALEKRIAQMAALLDRLPHVTRQGSHQDLSGDRRCPACAWQKLKNIPL